MNKEFQTKKSDKRLTVRLSDDIYQSVKYHAEKNGVSINDFVRNTIEFYIGVKAGDYPLENLETERLNELIHHIQTLSDNIHNLEEVTIKGFGSLIDLTRGDNYLMDYDDDNFLE